MVRILLTILSMTVALFQGLSFPWVNLFGAPVPLLLLTMLVCSKKYANYVPLIGAVGGLALDLVSSTPFGLWTLYYFCAGFILRLLLEKQNTRWWWTVIWLSAAIAANPLYAQAMSGQMDLARWLSEILWPTLIVTTISIWPAWLMRRPAERGL